MTTRPRVLLFDIDGTLLTCGGAGRCAMERAFAERTERSVADFSFGGMTDGAIVREALTRAELPHSDADVSAVLDRYLTFLEDELPRAAGYAVLAGVTQMLDLLDAERVRGAAIAVGLGTGNLRRGAELKLTHGGLWKRFAFGGYGSDDERRPALLDYGAVLGAAQLGCHREDVDVIVIGDTPKDVSAAREIGALCLAVASGTYDMETLRAAGADAVFPSMESLPPALLLGGDR